MVKREQKLLRIGAAAHELGLHPITVRRWIKSGRIQAVQMGREVRVPRAEIERMVGSKFTGRLVVLYGRVSGHGQKADLDTQLERLQTWAATERRGQETLFACFDVTLTVLEPGEEKTPEQELTDDLLALIASFSGRLYGMRSHKQQALVACAKQVLAEAEE